MGELVNRNSRSSEPSLSVVNELAFLFFFLYGLSSKANHQLSESRFLQRC